MVETAQTLSGIDLADVAQFELYSCFPGAVQILADALGLRGDDPRPRTATGGLPYFGGSLVGCQVQLATSGTGIVTYLPL